MILVATAAGVMVLIRVTDDARNLFGTRLDRNWLGRYAYQAEIWMPPVMIPTMMGALAVRLRGPRPSFRRLMRQPGAVASLLGVSVLTMRLILSSHNGLNWFAYRLRSSGADIGLSVAAGWAALALAGAFRRERGWIDGFGSIIGAVWSLLWLASYIPTGVTVF